MKIKMTREITITHEKERKKGKKKRKTEMILVRGWNKEGCEEKGIKNKDEIRTEVMIKEMSKWESQE